jgi:capsular polysaccharide export protein
VAREDHPNAHILIKPPETAQGHREGHYRDADLSDNVVTSFSDPISPHHLLDGAIAVYTVTRNTGLKQSCDGPQTGGLAASFTSAGA